MGCAIEHLVTQRRAPAPTPIAGMARPPRLDPGDVHRAPEVVLVLGLGAPAGLAGGLAGRFAGGGRAVTLVTAVARVRTESFRQHMHLRRSPEPSRPLLRGRIIGQGNARRSQCLNGPRAPSPAVPEHSIRWAGYRFKPLPDRPPHFDLSPGRIWANPTRLVATVG